MLLAEISSQGGISCSIWIIAILVEEQPYMYIVDGYVHVHVTYMHMYMQYSRDAGGGGGISLLCLNVDFSRLCHF